MLTQLRLVLLCNKEKYQHVIIRNFQNNLFQQENIFQPKIKIEKQRKKVKTREMNSYDFFTNNIMKYFLIQKIV